MARSSWQRSVRLTSKFNEFRAQKYENHPFNDLLLRSGGTEIRAQRLLLARACGWFSDALATLEPTRERNPRYVLDLPQNPGGCFGLFLDFLFSGRATITPENIANLLKIAVVYRADLYVRIFRKFLDKFFESERILTLVKRLLDLGLADDADRFAPKLSRAVADAILGRGEAAFVDEFLNTVSAPLLEKVLVGALRQDGVRGADWQEWVLRIVDGFVAAGGRPTEDEALRLASLVSWTDPGVQKRLVRYRLDWVPPAILLPLLQKGLANRRQVLAELGMAAAGADPILSQWYPLAYIGRLAALEPWGNDREFDIIRVISTFGGARPPINPTQFRLLSFQRRNGGEIIGFGPEKLFEPGGYVMTYPARGKRAKLRLDFAPAQVLVTAVEADLSVPPAPHRRHPLYFAPPPAPKLWPSAVFVDVPGDARPRKPVSGLLDPPVFPESPPPRALPPGEEEQEPEEEHAEPQREPSAQIDPSTRESEISGGKVVTQIEKEGSMVIIEFNGTFEFDIARLSALTVWGHILPKVARPAQA